MNEIPKLSDCLDAEEARHLTASALGKSPPEALFLSRFSLLVPILTARYYHPSSAPVLLRRNWDSAPLSSAVATFCSRAEMMHVCAILAAIMEHRARRQSQ